MSSSDYIRNLRSKIGNSNLLIPGVAAVILDKNGRLLLQEKHGEAWSLPAGMIEPTESPREAVVREVKEETGLIVTPNKVVGVFSGKAFRYTYPNGDAVENTVIVMRCSVLDDSGNVRDDETKSLSYFDKNRMPELALPYPLEVLFDELEDTYIL